MHVHFADLAQLHAFIAAEVVHAQRERVYNEMFANNKHLKELLKSKEDSLNAKEGDIRVLKKDRDDLAAVLKE